MRQIASAVALASVALVLAGCGSCGHGSYASDEPADAGPTVVKIGPSHEGGRPVRIRSVPVLRVDAAAPP